MQFNLKILAASISAMMLAGFAAAADAAEPVAVDVDRDGAQLQSIMTTRPDVDVFNTAIVASNNSASRAVVVCTAHNHRGEPVGRARMQIPANGLRFILASDLANGRDYLGSVNCATGNFGISTSAFLLGAAGLVNLPTETEALNNTEVHHVPVTLTR